MLEPVYKVAAALQNGFFHDTYQYVLGAAVTALDGVADGLRWLSDQTRAESKRMEDRQHRPTIVR